MESFLISFRCCISFLISSDVVSSFSFAFFSFSTAILRAFSAFSLATVADLSVSSNLVFADLASFEAAATSRKTVSL